MSLAIRPRLPGDAAALWDMLRPVFRAGESYALARDIPRADALAFWCDPPHEVFVAEEAGRPVGSFYLCANRPGAGAHVANCGFVTARAAEGRGVGRAMVDHALATARARGFRAMQFNFVVESNLRALALWQRAGFREVGRLPGAFAHPRLGDVDALVMWRAL